MDYKDNLINWEEDLVQFLDTNLAEKIWLEYKQYNKNWHDLTDEYPHNAKEKVLAWFYDLEEKHRWQILNI
tara:strand:+ start:219 stop:431 length:213 start_codon:yes stop_codon:yes gene_type:complete